MAPPGQASIVRVFSRLVLECSVCLLVGLRIATWWMGPGPGQGRGPALQPQSDAFGGDPGAPLARLPEPTGPPPATAPSAMAADSSLVSAPAEQIQWVEIPAQLLKESEGHALVSAFFANSSTNALSLTRAIKDLLRLDDAQHAALAEIMYGTGQEWAKLQSRRIQASPEGPYEWTVSGTSQPVARLELKFHQELRTALGAEKAGLLKAVGYQDLQRIFHGGEIHIHMADDRSVILHTTTKIGSASFHFRDSTTGTPVAIIAAALEQWQRSAPPN